ncbi:MAG: T9SS type A sorting domain-containing protein, partial [Ferruginibacter sp.]
VNSYSWDNGTITDAGASTWCDGITGRTGVVSSSNSLVGSTMNDQVGLYVVFLFSNGSYLVRNPNWANGAQSNAGAVTWCDGTTGRTGNISNANSLVGTTSGNSIGIGTTSELPNGNFLLGSWGWDNGALTNVGAYTMGSTTTGIYGEINATNSLIGSSVNDQLGQNGVQVANGNYFTKHNEWDNGALVNAGAVTLGNNSIPLTGYINSCNSVISNLASNSNFMRQTYNNVYDYLLVGRGLENIVTVYFPSGMSLANHLDAVDLTVSGTGKVPFVVTSGCRIIASLTPNGGSQVSGSVNAKVWIESTVPSYAGKPFVARHYQITPATNSSTATGRVTLYFTQQDFDDFNADPASIYDLPAFPNDILGKYNLKVGKYSGTSSNGSGLPGTYAGPSQVINPDDNDIIWNSVLNRWEVSFDVTGFSGFIVQSSSFLLPLSLLSFNGFLLNNDGLLNWKTTNELNAASYDIERSIDGRTYTAVGTVAAYNTAGNHQYNFTDNNITALGVPVVYYRLKQKDIIGRFTYSNIVALSIDRSKSIVLLYPNPVVTNANLTININKPQQVKGRIIDNTGRVLKQMQWSLAAGSTALPVDVKELASGMYYLEITGATLNERKVFVKQ